MGLLAEYTRGHFGRETRFNPVPLDTTITTTPSLVWRNNPDRLGLLVVNQGTADIFVATVPQVSPTIGIRVLANGGSLVLLAAEDGALVGYPLWAVAASGTQTIYTAEIEGR